MLELPPRGHGWMRPAPRAASKWGGLITGRGHVIQWVVPQARITGLALANFKPTPSLAAHDDVFRVKWGMSAREAQFLRSLDYHGRMGWESTEVLLVNR